MAQLIRIAATTGLFGVLGLLSAQDGSAHGGHHHQALASQHTHGSSAPPPSTNPNPDPNPNDPDDWNPWVLDNPNDTLGRCRWRAESADTGTGGVLAQCEEGEFPVTAGVFHGGEGGTLVHKGIVNLSPAWWMNLGVQNDGFLDGEALSDSHPQVHGEPPPDGVETEFFAPNVGGSGIHYEQGSGAPNEPNHIRTLCCETLPPKPGIGALRDCHYETALVEVVPETHPDLAGQYVASLPCTSGRVTSGGCHAQFLHSSDWALTGSHPYVDGDPMQMPLGSHATTPTQTGWACRLDSEPSMYPDPNAYDEGIGVTALCCK